MKKSVLVLGGFASFIFILGAISKIMHWPGASVMLVSSILLFALGFLPLLLMKTIQPLEGYNKVNLILLTLVGIGFSISSLLKVMHWPFANITWLITLGTLLLMFLPHFIITGLKNTESRDKVMSQAVIILFVGGILFTLTKLHSSQKERQETSPITTIALK